MNQIVTHFLKVYVSLETLSMSSFIFLSNNLLASVKPCFVFPNELGPDEVIVSRPTFLIRILASAGISSSSSDESSLKTEATDFLG